MTKEQLESLRKSRGLTREQLAADLGGCTAQAIVKWERGERAIPAWVEEKMMRAIPVTLPLDELHLLLDEAQASGLSADQIIAEAIRLWLKTKRPAENLIPIGTRREVSYKTSGGSGGSHDISQVAEEHEKHIQP
ncbi:MAG: hypothetical protein KCHDKBKB_03033 [Elusimicrobia bacterium]|nr:hypothetical protein [Elusimicrobiota bacterium]